LIITSFDLTTESWIPCTMSDGSFRELGLYEALAGAHGIREIVHGSPLVTVSLHRLLLALLHRSLSGPASLEEWSAWWARGQWDDAAVGAYLEKWRSRFDLFGEDHPFYQVADIPDAPGTLPVSVLAHELASGNNATLFDHNVSANPAPMTPGGAARYLVAMQGYAIGGGVASPFNFTGGPLTAGLTMLVLGDTLFETLALNLLPYRRDVPVQWTGEDGPAWEVNDQPRPDKAGTHPRGYLDLLTWQSRRFRLIPEGDPPVVRWCRRQQNMRLVENIRDPFKHYRRTKDKGWVATTLRPARALWRDSDVLFQHTVEAHSPEQSVRPPLQFDLLAGLDEMRVDEDVEMAPAYRLAAFGVATEPGKPGSLLLWRQERLPLPLSYLLEPNLVVELATALKAADEAHDALRYAVRVLAQYLLPPGSDTSFLTRSLGAESRYWWRLDSPAADLIAGLPGDMEIDADGVPRFGAVTRPHWLGSVRAAAREALEETTRDLDVSGDGLRAMAHAERAFGAALARALENYSMEEAIHAATT
jgi:CRISPR system Cascade subunit CasA